MSLSEGAVINVGTRQTVTLVTNTDFINNTAIKGGVLNVEDESVVKCVDCVFANNFASVSGVARVIDNGHYEIYSSQIYNNYASQSPISEMFDSVFASVIGNTTMYNNIALTEQEIIKELNDSCIKL